MSLLYEFPENWGKQVSDAHSIYSEGVKLNL